MASMGACDACQQTKELVSFNNNMLCVLCQKDYEDYLQHQYEPEYSGIVDCAQCGYPNASDDVFPVEVNGQLFARCKECPYTFPWPAFWDKEREE